jgi:NADH-quinone oxidoreductase subunit M
MPKYAVAFMIFTMANVGLPGTSGFVGEFLTLMGVFQVNTWVALFAATGVILSAAYAVALPPRRLRRAGEGKPQGHARPVGPREGDPLSADRAGILFGVYPAPIFDVTAASVDALINNYTASLQAARDLALSTQ